MNRTDFTNIDVDRTIGALVAEQPSRARVFERFGIDYCCGGNSTLRDACAQHGVDTDEVLAALRESQADISAPASTEWTRAALGELIDDILETHHAYLRRELPRLAELGERVRVAHAEKHPEIPQVEETYNNLRAELELHMMKEEQILFPMIRQMESSKSCGATHCGSVRNPISVMEHEHDSAGAALKRMRDLTGGFNPPSDASTRIERGW